MKFVLNNIWLTKPVGPMMVPLGMRYLLVVRSSVSQQPENVRFAGRDSSAATNQNRATNRYHDSNARRSIFDAAYTERPRNAASLAAFDAARGAT